MTSVTSAPDRPSAASPSFTLPGAVAAPPGAIDQGVPWHYGDPFGEQRLLAQGVGVVDLSHRGVVRVTGPDRLGWLHSITSQHLDALPTGGSTTALVLSPHGHVELELHVIDDGAATWLLADVDAVPRLLAYLESMRFLLRVEPADVSADWVVVGRPGHEGDEELAWRSPTQFASTVASDPDEARYVPTRPGTWAVREVVVRRQDLATELAGDAPVGSWAWEAARVAAAVPRVAVDADHRTLPHELGLVPAAVHLHKGCYRGQETVARVHNLGRPPRRLVLLHLDGSDDRVVAHGDEVRVDARPVGRVLSVVQHHDLGPIALALLKRATPVDAAVTAGGVAAGQEVVVIP